jgi:MoxR-like ATPase
MKNKLFDPPIQFRQPRLEDGEKGPSVADDRGGRVYLFTREIIDAVNVALATGRPILVRGPSGCGKSSMARAVANFKQWRYYERVITSRTEARDLLYEVDLLRRLHDAQIAREKDTFDADFTPYVVPGVLWWGFNKKSAQKRGKEGEASFAAAKEPPCDYPDGERAVILLDEIDKADPDVPNNLLVPLGSLEFRVDETSAQVRVDPERAPLLFITSNRERELPPAFMRRCVDLDIPAPERTALENIAKLHFRGKDAWVTALMTALVPKDSRPPSAAECIDVLRACEKYEIEPGSPEWDSVKALTLGKPTRP